MPRRCAWVAGSSQPTLPPQLPPLRPAAVIQPPGLHEVEGPEVDALVQAISSEVRAASRAGGLLGGKARPTVPARRACHGVTARPAPDVSSCLTTQLPTPTLAPAPAAHRVRRAAAEGREQHEGVPAAAGAAPRPAAAPGRAAGRGRRRRAGAGAAAAGTRATPSCRSRGLSTWGESILPFPVIEQPAVQQAGAGLCSGCFRHRRASQPAALPHLHPAPVLPPSQDRTFVCLHYCLDADGRLHPVAADPAGSSASGAPVGADHGSGGSDGGDTSHRRSIEGSNVQLGVMVRKGVGGTCPLRQAPSRQAAADVAPPRSVAAC